MMRRGFTLVELMIVITIIVVLIAMLLPVLASSREQGRRALCGNNLRQIGMAITNYSIENNDDLFAHHQSINFPTDPQWDASMPEYIPYPDRTSDVRANSIDDAPFLLGWHFDLMGGLLGGGGFYPSIFPRFITTGKVFVCPSVHLFGLADNDDPTTHFDTAEQNIVSGLPWYFVSSYVGNLYGRLTVPESQRGHYFWESYWIQGYYPYEPDYLSLQGSLMWDVGSYVFWYGTAQSNQGCHLFGQNTLFVDGRVSWRNFSWIN